MKVMHSTVLVFIILLSETHSLASQVRNASIGCVSQSIKYKIVVLLTSGRRALKFAIIRLV